MSSARTSRRPVSLKQRLAARARPRLPYSLLVDDPTEAQQRVEQVRSEMRQALLRDRDRDDYQPVVDAARAELQAAQEQLAACSVEIMLRALRPADYEALIAKHPPTAAQAAETPPQIWNPDTFRPALLAGCADGDMTADDWATFLAENVSAGERQGLYVACLMVNEQERIADPLALPKGLTSTRS